MKNPSHGWVFLCRITMNFELFYETIGVCTDTRNILKDCLFICLKGANFNGNSFAEQALQAGAKYVIADEDLFPGNPRVYVVNDALEYLQQLAHYHRNKFEIPVIGITGSNGKTSTKELIATVLKEQFNVLYTQGNLNNHIGVPLTLLNLNNTHDIAVIEMGANKFKDIEELCNIASPTHGIITNIGRAHLEGFINFEGVLKTKRELYQAIEKNQGTIFYNADDEILRDILPARTNTFSYASLNQGDIQGELLALTPFVRMKWSDGTYRSEEIQTNMIGNYNFYNFLAAVAVGTFFKVSPTSISDAIASYAPSNNRSQVRETEKNTLIMDAYNANPTSMRSALESFSAIKQENKIAILGDMFELGAESLTEHQKIADLLNELGVDAICIGNNFQKAIQENGNSLISFPTKEEARIYLANASLSGKLILLKGSRGIGLESLTDLL